MTDPGPAMRDPFEDAVIAARLCAIDPLLGGILLRGGGDLRDLIIAELRAGLPGDSPFRKIPLHIDDERLLGGIDLTATLARGTAITRAGLLAEANGGLVVLPMAERLCDATAAKIAAALDNGESRFLLLVQDDGIEIEERSPPSLAERVAFWIDLSMARPAEEAPADWLIEPGAVDEASPDVLAAIAGTAMALGIESSRAMQFTLRASYAAARLAGRRSIAAEDVQLAARLVLGPRATRVPSESLDQPADEPPPSDPERGEEEGQGDRNRPLDDIILEAVLASLPKDLLARLAAGSGRRKAAGQTRGAGERRTSAARGRPAGTRAGIPGNGHRLSLIDTLRAAAPWQKLRGRDGRIEVRRDDLRLRRFETRAEALTIFAVDASGSSALARLAEAKGAVELLLAEAYVKRTQVALVAFRGTAAELLLPPTRSLARARRSLAELPGGGGTPLAAGLNAARELAESARARGRTPFVVVLTDGRANIAADGSTVRATAEADATAAAKAIGMAGIAAAFVDISARPRPEGAALAKAMGAHYLPLPRADSAAMHAAVRAAQKE